MNDTSTLTLDQRVARLEQRLAGIEAWALRQNVAATALHAPAAPAVSPVAVAPTVPSAAVSAAPTPVLAPPAAMAGGASPAPLPPPGMDPSSPVRATQPAVRIRPPLSASDLEQMLSGRGLAAIGGLAILVGAVYFLSLAFTRGWIGPSARVGIGLLAGALLTAGGGWFFERREATFGHALLATGIGISTIALMAGTRLYGLFPVGAGLVGSLILVGVATIVALRCNSQIVAGYGLIAALAAPPLLGAATSGVTLTFLATVLIGTTALALYRSWQWLPPSAFFLSAPQLTIWLDGRPGLGLGMTVLAGFWLLNALASAGNEVRLHRPRLHPSSASLLVLNAVLLVSSGLALLNRSDAGNLQGLFLIAVALVHWAIAAPFLRREGLNHPWGVLVAGTGVAAFTMAFPIQLGGPVVAIAWSAEAVALAWVYERFQHRWSGRAALVLGGLALGHLLVVEYPFYDSFFQPHAGIAFINRSGGTAAWLLLSLAAARQLVKNGKQRAALAIAFGLLLTYVLPFELTAAGFVVGLALLALGVIVIGRRDAEERIYLAFGLVGAGLAALVVLARVAPLDYLVLRDIPAASAPTFWRDATLSLGALVAVLVLAARLYADRLWAHRLVAAAGVVAVYWLSVELVDLFQRQIGGGASIDTLYRQSQVALSILWAVIGGGVFVFGVVRRAIAARIFGLSLLALATIKVFVFDLATLDTTARVASFIGLGILLLASSYMYQHVKPQTPRTP